MLTMQKPLKSPLILLKRSPTTLACALIATSLLSACSDSNIQTGTGAGDAAESAKVLAATTLLQPFVGVYELQSGWSGGDAGDRAFLSIRLTSNDGTSEAALIDFDDIDNCLPSRFSTGVVRKDDFSDRVFMDDILQFDAAELTLAIDTLSIEFTDLDDLNNDGNRTDDVIIQASRLGLSEIDLGPTCQ